MLEFHTRNRVNPFWLSSFIQTTLQQLFLDWWHNWNTSHSLSQSSFQKGIYSSRKPLGMIYLHKPTESCYEDRRLLSTVVGSSFIQDGEITYQYSSPKDEYIPFRKVSLLKGKFILGDCRDSTTHNLPCLFCRPIFEKCSIRTDNWQRYMLRFTQQSALPWIRIAPYSQWASFSSALSCGSAAQNLTLFLETHSFR